VSVSGEPAGSLPRELRTQRLRLRRWLPADREPFAALNADPRVAEFLPAPLAREASDALAARVEAHFETHGFGLWAVEAPGVTSFVGFAGLSIPAFSARFTPCVEIGWRLAVPFWGRGYATEAARAALGFGFRQLRLGEIVSFTVPGNLRSRRVMEKLGMRRDPADDFDHPALPEGHPFRRHVLYRIARAAADPEARAARIRSAGAGDLPFLREMLFEAAFWREGAPRPDLEAGLARPDLAKLLAGWGRAGDAAVIAESSAGEPVGAAWYRFWSSESHSYGFVAADVPELGLAVRADCRRRGLGERLLRALLEQAGRAGVARISLSVERENPARRLYQRVGFRDVEPVGGAWTMLAEAPRRDAC
jgi:RimJ/RimL family protein N-acetyltransferase